MLQNQAMQTQNNNYYDGSYGNFHQTAQTIQGLKLFFNI